MERQLASKLSCRDLAICGSSCSSDCAGLDTCVRRRYLDSEYVWMHDFWNGSARKIRFGIGRAVCEFYKRR